MTPEMFALQQLGMPINFNHVKGNAKAAAQQKLDSNANRSIFASEKSSLASKVLPPKPAVPASPGDNIAIKSRDLTTKKGGAKPPIVSKIDNKRGMKSR